MDMDGAFLEFLESAGIAIAHQAQRISVNVHLIDKREPFDTRAEAELRRARKELQATIVEIDNGLAHYRALPVREVA